MRRLRRGAARWFFAGALALAAAAALEEFAPDRPALAVDAAPESGAIVGVASVIDGDTIEIHGARIRFAGIDAPESRQTCGGERVGRRAALALDAMTSARIIVCAPRGLDRYNRRLADCRAGALDLNAEMVRQGWAWDYVRYSGARYAAEEREARNARRGVWAHECEPAWRWRAASRN